MMHWTTICQLEDIVPNTGVGALLEGHQVAVFRLDDDSVFAIDNFDPRSGANVLSRGIVGDLDGRLVVASPIYKQHIDLATGECLEAPEHSVTAHGVRVVAGTIEIRLASALHCAA